MPGEPLVLVCDDEPIILEVITRVLRKAGYRVLAAARGDEALQLAMQSGEPVRLAVLDIVIPNLSGPELFQRLRKIHPSIRVLFITAYHRPPHGVRAQDELLTKPFTADELVHRVGQLAQPPLHQHA